MSGSIDGPRVTFLLPGNGQQPVGGYKVVYEYANGLSRRGWRVTVSHVIRFERPSYNSRALRSNRGLPVRPSRPVWFPLDKAVRSLQWAGWNQFVVRHEDAVVATAWQTAEGLGPDPRGLYLIQGYETWHGPVDRVDATWRLPLRKLVISGWLAEKADELGAGPVTMVPNAIDTEVFNMDVAPEDRSSEEIVMLWANVEWKGSKDGLEALRAVKAAPPRHTLLDGETSGGVANLDNVHSERNTEATSWHL